MPERRKRKRRQYSDRREKIVQNNATTGPRESLRSLGRAPFAFPERVREAGRGERARSLSEPPERAAGEEICPRSFRVRRAVKENAREKERMRSLNRSRVFGARWNGAHHMAMNAPLGSLFISLLFLGDSVTRPSPVKMRSRSRSLQVRILIYFPEHFAQRDSLTPFDARSPFFLNIR